MRLYHTTSHQAAKRIVETQVMYRGRQGSLGPGIYFAGTYELAIRKAIHSKQEVLSAEVELGRIYETHTAMQGMTWTELQRMGYDSIVNKGMMTGIEYCVYSSSQVTDIQYLQWGPSYEGSQEFYLRVCKQKSCKMYGTKHLGSHQSTKEACKNEECRHFGKTHAPPHIFMCRDSKCKLKGTYHTCSHQMKGNLNNPNDDESDGEVNEIESNNDSTTVINPISESMEMQSSSNLDPRSNNNNKSSSSSLSTNRNSNSTTHASKKANICREYYCCLHGTAHECPHDFRCAHTRCPGFGTDHPDCCDIPQCRNRKCRMYREKHPFDCEIVVEYEEERCVIL